MAIAGGGFGVGFLLIGFFQRSVMASSFGAVSLLAAFFSCIKQGTSIDMEQRIVTSEGYLFGRLCLWLRRRPLSDFVAVRCRRVMHADANDTVFLGFERRGGRVMEIRYYTVAHGGPASQAWSEARWLAEVTGLPLHESPA